MCKVGGNCSQLQQSHFGLSAAPTSNSGGKRHLGSVSPDEQWLSQLRRTIVRKRHFGLSQHPRRTILWEKGIWAQTAAPTNNSGEKRHLGSVSSPDEFPQSPGLFVGAQKLCFGHFPPSGLSEPKLTFFPHRIVRRGCLPTNISHHILAHPVPCHAVGMCLVCML